MQDTPLFALLVIDSVSCAYVLQPIVVRTHMKQCLLLVLHICIVHSLHTSIESEKFKDLHGTLAHFLTIFTKTVKHTETQIACR